MWYVLGAFVGVMVLLGILLNLLEAEQKVRVLLEADGEPDTSDFSQSSPE